MIQQLHDGIFQITVPLPNSPLKVLNTYLIRGERSLLIDTGFNLMECETALRSALAELNVDIKQLDVFLTHLHNDHAGLLARIHNPEMTIYCGANFADLDNWRENYYAWPYNVSTRLLRLNQNALEDMQEMNPHWLDGLTPILLAEGSVLNVGQYQLKVIDTPGHTMSHACLYEEKLNILFSGDHILNRISPNIISMEFGGQDLSLYLTSLVKIRKMNVDIAYPGHRTIITDVNGRIDELIEHHRLRLQEIDGILVGGAQTVVEVAAKASWNVKIKSWEDFPIVQKIFALGETLSHLNYLSNQGRIRTEQIQGEMYFEKI